MEVTRKYGKHPESLSAPAKSPTMVRPGFGARMEDEIRITMAGLATTQVHVKDSETSVYSLAWTFDLKASFGRLD